MQLASHMAQLRIRYNIPEEDFTKNLIHISNQEQIRELASKYNLASEYPRERLNQIWMPYASRIVIINRIRVHLILNWSLMKENENFGLWAFPDEEKYIAKYSHIFDTLYEISLKWLNSSI